MIADPEGPSFTFCSGPDVPHLSKLFNIHMMCWGTGRERTEAEYTRLLEQAGWYPSSSHYPANRQMGVVTGIAE